ncbi:hypothetical protein [Microbispora hainanensis]|uniref:Uncharacterized protein n=1 Tax=Microbispora hainanensis TaxID=568844 RepID=A0A544Y523_9ACTN|nr:hypothetical protein [Microbispora hainanensis]TQS11866.1 hypothetical protein FLX08_36745 [Microbispora hainanensis]
MSDLVIHTYSAAEPGLFASSYLLETADGVVLVEGNLLVSDARGGKRVAFTGDLAFGGTHPYTADGHSTAWPHVLDRVTLAAVAGEAGR